MCYAQTCFVCLQQLLKRVIPPSLLGTFWGRTIVCDKESGEDIARACHCQGWGIIFAEGRDAPGILSPMGRGNEALSLFV